MATTLLLIFANLLGISDNHELNNKGKAELTLQHEIVIIEDYEVKDLLDF